MKETGDCERILVVDDEEGLLKLLTIRLEGIGYKVTPCTSAEAAMEEARRSPFDLLITDLRLPGKDGLTLMQELRAIHPNTPVIMLTAHGSIPNAVEAMQKGAFGYLTKPFDNKELQIYIEKALGHQQMTQEIQRLKSLVKELYGIENVVAASQSMQVLLQQVKQVAETDATIYLSGETGTGKEVIARVIHANSRRARGPFVAVNCGAIPESLFESELFGHAKGAFTGAHGHKRGLFQSADGGTLFLDEIGEMPLMMQVKLLRVLQEREIQVVGADRPTKVDVRIITATNKDLWQEVQSLAFREDLYYRIRVFPLPIPPLRDRREDIPPLAQHFLERCAKRMNKHIRGLVPEAMQMLVRYHWPGNVRELENTIEKAAVMATQDMLTPDLFPSLTVAPTIEGQLKPLTEAKEEFEKGYLKELLQVSGGNISRAAQLAGRYRADFYKLLKKYGLHPADRKTEEEEQ